MLEKLAWARSAWPFWNASQAAGTARHVLMLLSERGPGGMLEHSGAKLGCLGVRVAQPGEM